MTSPYATFAFTGLSRGAMLNACSNDNKSPSSRGWRAAAQLLEEILVKGSSFRARYQDARRHFWRPEGDTGA
jgi:hypothetical protein